MDGGAWWATVHRVAKRQTQLSNFTSLLFFNEGTGQEQVAVIGALPKAPNRPHLELGPPTPTAGRRKAVWPEASCWGSGVDGDR